jgi:hypothetical protein
MSDDFGGDSLHPLGMSKKEEGQLHNSTTVFTWLRNISESLSTTIEEDFSEAHKTNIESSQATIIQAVARGYLCRKDNRLRMRPTHLCSDSVSSLGDTVHSLWTSSTTLGGTLYSFYSNDLQSECDASQRLDDLKLSTADNDPMDLPLRPPMRQSSPRNFLRASCPNFSPTPEKNAPPMDLPLTPPMRQSSVHNKLARAVQTNVCISDCTVPDIKRDPIACLESFKPKSYDILLARDEPVKRPERQKSRRSLFPQKLP